MLEELAKEIHFAGTHAETKVIILKSSGDKAFVPGRHLMNCCKLPQKRRGVNFLVVLLIS